MKIEILTFQGCPHGAPAQELAREVAADLAPDARVEEIDVKSPAHAHEVGFLGSPSFRVDGHDIEGRPRPFEGVMSCRVYGTSGLPPRWQLEAAILRAAPPRSLLFLCVANSARSQLAEAVARKLAPAEVAIHSAGSAPTQVRPEALAVLQERDIKASDARSKSVDSLEGTKIDTVITLCAEEVCPTWLQPARHLHWGLSDPAAVEESEDARLDAFRATRDELLRRLRMIWR